MKSATLVAMGIIVLAGPASADRWQRAHGPRTPAATKQVQRAPQRHAQAPRSTAGHQRSVIQVPRSTAGHQQSVIQVPHSTAGHQQSVIQVPHSTASTPKPLLPGHLPANSDLAAHRRNSRTRAEAVAYLKGKQIAKNPADAVEWAKAGLPVVSDWRPGSNGNRTGVIEAMVLAGARSPAGHPSAYPHVEGWKNEGDRVTARVVWFAPDSGRAVARTNEIVWVQVNRANGTHSPVTTGLLYSAPHMQAQRPSF